MDVFNYMQSDSDMINDRFIELADNYSEWAQDRVFEETKNALAGVKSHLQKEQLFINNLKDRSGIDRILEEAQKQREAIISEIEQLVMIHVDEPGFEQGLESIGDKFETHRKFCVDTLYPRLKDRLSPADLQHVSDQLEQKVLSGQQRTD